MPGEEMPTGDMQLNELIIPGEDENEVAMGLDELTVDGESPPSMWDEPASDKSPEWREKTADIIDGVDDMILQPGKGTSSDAKDFADAFEGITGADLHPVAGVLKTGNTWLKNLHTAANIGGFAADPTPERALGTWIDATQRVAEYGLGKIGGVAAQFLNPIGRLFPDTMEAAINRGIGAIEGRDLGEGQLFRPAFDVVSGGRSDWISGRSREEVRDFVRTRPPREALFGAIASWW